MNVDEGDKKMRKNERQKFLDKTEANKCKRSNTEGLTPFIFIWQHCLFIECSTYSTKFGLLLTEHALISEFCNFRIVLIYGSYIFLIS